MSPASGAGSMNGGALGGFPGVAPAGAAVRPIAAMTSTAAPAVTRSRRFVTARSPAAARRRTVDVHRQFGGSSIGPDRSPGRYTVRRSADGPMLSRGGQLPTELTALD